MAAIASIDFHGKYSSVDQVVSDEEKIIQDIVRKINRVVDELKEGNLGKHAAVHQIDQNVCSFFDLIEKVERSDELKEELKNKIIVDLKKCIDSYHKMAVEVVEIHAPDSTFDTVKKYIAPALIVGSVLTAIIFRREIGGFISNITSRNPRVGPAPMPRADIGPNISPAPMPRADIQSLVADRASLPPASQIFTQLPRPPAIKPKMVMTPDGVPVPELPEELRPTPAIAESGITHLPPYLDPHIELSPEVNPHVPHNAPNAEVEAGKIIQGPPSDGYCGGYEVLEDGGRGYSNGVEWHPDSGYSINGNPTPFGFYPKE